MLVTFSYLVTSCDTNPEQTNPEIVTENCTGSFHAISITGGITTGIKGTLGELNCDSSYNLCKAGCAPTNCD